MADKGEIASLSEAMAGLPKDFAFFPERFRSVIQPTLTSREGDRLKAVAKQRNFAIAGVLLGVAAGLVGWFAWQTWIGAAVGALGAFGLWAWGSMDINNLARQTKLLLVEPIASEFGMAYELAPAFPSEINELRRLGLVPGWDRCKFEDRITGVRHDTPFEFFEAHLEEKRTTTDSKGRTRTTWVTVFRGQCLVVKFHKQFNGVTRVYRDAGAFNWLAKLGNWGKGERVKLEDPVFEKAFEVYSTDQLEARFILTPDFMERLVGLERAFKGRQVRCAFAGGEMLLACEGANLLEVGSMYRPMDDLRRVRDMLADYAAIFLLIDAMAQRLTPDALRQPAGPGG